MYTHLISVEQLQLLQTSGKPLMVFDCSFDLSDPALGAAMFAEAHIPGAVHADLDRLLSSKDAQRRASGGRHPLPLREDFAAALQAIGFRNDMQAVVYDRNGNNYCGRLWWMLNWLGHEAVAILDGGLAAWKAAGLPLESGTVTSSSSHAPFVIGASRVRLADTASVVAGLEQPQHTLIDSRGPARYSGAEEPIDPVAGHIPGALNRPFPLNMDAEGRFKPIAQLREEFAQLLQGRDPAGVTIHCGSGVSAVPNIVAMELAGLPRPALYAGSWSEWCTTEPALPVERG